MSNGKIRSRKDGTKYPISEPEVRRVGGRAVFGRSKIHPYKVVARLRDGRRFELRVKALSKDEAVEITKTKFPLVAIHSVSRADKIKTVGKALETAERLLEGDDSNDGESLF